MVAWVGETWPPLPVVVVGGVDLAGMRMEELALSSPTVSVGRVGKTLCVVCVWESLT